MLSHYHCHEGGPSEPPRYTELGTLLLSSGDDAVKALFLRGLPSMLGSSTLLVSFVCWFVFTALMAGSPVPCGLLVPLIITGACRCVLAMHDDGLPLSAPHHHRRVQASARPPPNSRVCRWMHL